MHQPGLLQALARQEAGDLYLESDGVRIRYTDTGAGAPVILLHGFGGRLDDWDQTPLPSSLAARFRLIAMDVRGNGKSSKPRDPAAYGMAVVEDVVRLMDHLRLPKAHVIGYSLGARMALRLLLSYPDRLSSAILIGSGVTLPEDLALYETSAEAIASGDVDVGDNDPAALAAMMRAIPATDRWGVLEADLADFVADGAPFLLAVGSDDPNKPGVDRLAQLVPEAGVVVLQGHDHQTVLGASQLVTAVGDFLRSAGGRPYRRAYLILSLEVLLECYGVVESRFSGSEDERDPSRADALDEGPQLRLAGS